MAKWYKVILINLTQFVHNIIFFSCLSIFENSNKILSITICTFLKAALFQVINSLLSEATQKKLKSIKLNKNVADDATQKQKKIKVSKGKKFSKKSKIEDKYLEFKNLDKGGLANLRKGAFSKQKNNAIKEKIKRRKDIYKNKDAVEDKINKRVDVKKNMNTAETKIIKRETPKKSKKAKNEKIEKKNRVQNNEKGTKSKIKNSFKKEVKAKIRNSLKKDAKAKIRNSLKKDAKAKTNIAKKEN